MRERLPAAALAAPCPTRRRLALAALAMPAALAACGGGCGCSAGDAPAPDEPATPGAFTVRNTTAAAQAIDLQVNGRRLFASDSQILDELRGTLPDASAQAFAVSLWRLIVRDRYHFDPFAGAQWAHSPTLLFNSIGFGYCDDVAAAYAALARLAGHEARVWALEGHVVPEVRVDGRWQVFDPDLEVYYLGRDGLVQGVEALMADTTLITSPWLDAPPPWATELARAAERMRAEPAGSLLPYSEAVAAIYGSAADNAVADWYDRIPALSGGALPLVLPPKSRLLLGDAPSGTLASLYGTPVPRFATLSLVVPAGWREPVRLPLVPHAVHGRGEVLLAGERLVLGSPELAARLADRGGFAHTVTILGSDGDVAIEYLFNDTRFGASAIRDVRVGGVAAGAVTVARRPFGAAERFDLAP